MASDDNDMFDDDSTDETTSEQTPGWRRKLERDAKAGREAQEKAARLEREIAFRKAGIDPDDPKHKYFAKGYDGEITAEAIKAEAEAAGLVGGEQTPAPSADLAALDRVSQASAGAGVAPAEDAVQGLYDADREGGRDAVIARLRRDGLVNVE